VARLTGELEAARDESRALQSSSEVQEAQAAAALEEARTTADAVRWFPIVQTKSWALRP
jgi:hypothetical protein